MATERDGLADGDASSTTQGAAAAATRRVGAFLARLSPPADDAVLNAEPASPHTVATLERDLPSPRATTGRTSPALVWVAIAAFAAAGLAGGVLLLGTSPWAALAPPAWRVSVPGLSTAGGSFYAASTFILGILLLAAGWLGLVSFTTRGVRTERFRLKTVLAVAVLWAIPFAIAPIQLSTDAYSYAAQGDLANLGFDPGTVGPNALPNHGSNHFWQASDTIWRGSPAPYGPVAVGVEKTVVSLSGFDVSLSVWGLRVVAIIGIVLAGVGVYLIARSRRVSPAVALALAIANPVVMVHLVGGAHNDALMMGLLLLGMASWERSRKYLAVVLVSLAIAVKLPAVIALAFIAWNWKGKDARWQQRLLSFPLVGAVAAGVIAVLSLIVGIGPGWLTALQSTGKVYSTFSVFTKLGFLTSDLLHWMGLQVDPILSVNIARGIGLVISAAAIMVVLVRSPKVGVTKSVGLALLLLMFCGPVIWPWYLPAGFALLAAVGIKRLRPTMIVLIIASSVLVFPTSVNPIDSLSPYQHYIGFGVVLLIAGCCVAAQYAAAYTQRRRGRLTYQGHVIDEIRVGSAADDEALDGSIAEPVAAVVETPSPAPAVSDDAAQAPVRATDAVQLAHD